MVRSWLAAGLIACLIAGLVCYVASVIVQLEQRIEELEARGKSCSLSRACATSHLAISEGKIADVLKASTQ